MIHHHRPDLIDYHALDKVSLSVVCTSLDDTLTLAMTAQTAREENTELAFTVAQEHLGIPVRP